MAVAAGHPSARVRPRVDGEPGVIEDRSQPGCRGVAGRARSWEVRRHMVGIGSALIGCQMAGRASSGRSGIVPINVTRRAGNCGMGAGQWEGACGMVVCRPQPIGRGVAGGTIGGEPHRRVVGIGRPLIVRQVTGGAISRRSANTPADVACRTVKPGMGA